MRTALVVFSLFAATSAFAGGPPAEWTCAEIFWGADDGCDCGCGSVDPDCVDATLASCR